MEEKGWIKRMANLILKLLVKKDALKKLMI
jgi:hypothetical protein